MLASAPMSFRSPARLAAVVVALLAVPAMTAVADAAGRPPAPQGVPRVSPGHLPKPCGPGDEKYGFRQENSVPGTYYDARVKQWVNGPYCFPVWGFLRASGPQIVDPGQVAAVVATPTDGSNSGQYAPDEGSITWSAAGKRDSGCKVTTLVCAVVPAKRGTGSWQWFEVEVSMPRTYFIFSRGSLCEGIVACPGAVTHAWTWIGVRPKARNGCGTSSRCVELSGRVVRREVDTQVTGRAEVAVRGAPGVRVQATRGRRRLETSTTGDGTYSLRVPRGRWIVRLGHGEPTEPTSRTVNAQRDTPDLDFVRCRPGPDPGGNLDKGCRLVRIRGSIADRYGTRFPSMELNRLNPASVSPGTQGPGIVVRSTTGSAHTDDHAQDVAAVDAQGRFEIWTTPGSSTLWFSPYNDGLASSPAHVVAPHNVDNLHLNVPAAVQTTGDRSLIHFWIGLLPSSTRPPLKAKIERTEPVLNDICQYNQTVDVDLWYGNLAGATFQPDGFTRYCDGPYTAIVYDALGFGHASTTFKLGGG